MKKSGAVLLIFLCIYGVILFKYSERFGHNFSGFICLGDRFLPPGIITENTIYLKDSVGYDGQYNFFIAHDLLITRGMDKYMDDPAYRYQRIMYPLLTALFSGGNPELVPAMLIFVNIGAIALGTYFLIRILGKNRLSCWYALFYPFLSGLLIAALRDLSIPVAAGFMVAGLFFYEDGRELLSSAFIASAILARETLFILVAVLALDSIVFKRKRRAFVRILPSIFLPLGWYGYISLKLSNLPWHGGMQNMGLPLQGLVRETLKMTEKGKAETAYFYIFLFVSILSLALAVREIVRSRNEITTGFLLFSTMPLFMTQKVWIEPWSYGRVLVPGAVFLILNFSRSRGKIHLIPMSFHALLFIVTLFWQKIL